MKVWQDKVNYPLDIFKHFSGGAGGGAGGSVTSPVLNLLKNKFAGPSFMRFLQIVYSIIKNA